MRRIATILSCVFITCISYGINDWAISVGTTNSVHGVPYANNYLMASSTNLWSTGTVYAAQTYVYTERAVGSNTERSYYWTPNGGTSGTNSTVVTNGYNPMTASYVTVTNWTDTPTHGFGIVTGADGIRWKRCQESGRNSLYITALTSDNVFYSFGRDADGTSSGGVIIPQNPIVYLEDCNDSIEFFMPSGTSTVHVVEVE